MEGMQQGWLLQQMVDSSRAAAWRGLVPSQMTQTFDKEKPHRHPLKKSDVSVIFSTDFSFTLFYTAYTMSSQCYSTLSTTCFHISFSCGQHLTRSLALTWQAMPLGKLAAFTCGPQRRLPRGGAIGRIWPQTANWCMDCATSLTRGPFVNDLSLEQ